MVYTKGELKNMIEQMISKCRMLLRAEHTDTGLFSFEDFEVVFNGKIAYIKNMRQIVYDRISGFDRVSRNDATWTIDDADLVLDLEQHGNACVISRKTQAKHGGRPRKRISTTEILRRKNNGESITSIARHLGVHRDTI